MISMIYIQIGLLIKYYNKPKEGVGVIYLITVSHYSLILDMNKNMNKKIMDLNLNLYLFKILNNFLNML